MTTWFLIFVISANQPVSTINFNQDGDACLRIEKQIKKAFKTAQATCIDVSGPKQQ